MTGQKIGETTVRSEVLDVYVSLTGGRGGDASFALSREGDENALGRGPTLKAAKAAASAELRRRSVTVEVPFLHLVEHRYRDGFEIKAAAAQAFHAGRRSGVIAEYADGSKDTMDTGWAAPTYKADTPHGKLARLVAVRAEIAKLREEEKRITDAYGLRLDEAVSAAIEAKVAAEEAAAA